MSLLTYRFNVFEKRAQRKSSCLLTTMITNTSLLNSIKIQSNEPINIVDCGDNARLCLK